MVSIAERACVYCGAVLESAHARRRFCSRACKDSHSWRKTHPSIERTCLTCGVSMTGKRGHAVYCSRSCKGKAASRRAIESGVARVKDKQRYAREAEHRRAYARRYWSEHRNWLIALHWRREAVKAGVAVYEFTSKDWRRLVARFRGRCAYCSTKADLQPDHVIPLARGGAHSAGNIVPSCGSCNYRKHRRFLMEWRHA